MKISFFSNYLTHHQLPFCLEMQKILGDEFKFVATAKITNERLNLGWEDFNDKYDFVIKSYEDEEKAKKLAIESDVIILGSAPSKFIKMRSKLNKVSIRYNERPFKKGFDIKRFIYYSLFRKIYEHKNVYMLCASAYTAYDFNIANLYKDKCYKYGYFPEVKKYENIESIIEKKNDTSIIWVARFIEWKHPEIVIQISKKLKEDGYKFKVNMIGVGPLEENIKKQIIDNKLQDYIKLLGSMSPEKVREQMEKNKIFLFTSDRNEGWGAVLNEAMNSACAVVASHEIGSVPFLIKENKNGLIYESGNVDELYSKVKLLLDNNDLAKDLGVNAYKTMLKEWNSNVAAERVIELSKALLENKKFDKYVEGPCSKAKVIDDNWYNSGDL